MGLDIAVYPRVGGGTTRLQLLQKLNPGLSPRGRGNRPEGGGRDRERGSIPAWAGEPLYSTAKSRAQGVYPRVGGGTYSNTRKEGTWKGLSPRGRGNLRGYPPPLQALRSIPAWAGEPLWLSTRYYHNPVYPRVGGGTLVGK